MNRFDIFIAILLSIALIIGYRKGFVKQLVGLAVILLSAIFGGKLAELILPQLSRIINVSSNIETVLSFLIAFLLISLVTSLIGYLLQKIIDVASLSFLNRLLGAVVAITILTIVLSLLLNLTLIVDQRERVLKKELRNSSLFFKPIEAVAPAIVPFLNRKFKETFIPDSRHNRIESKSDSLLRSVPGPYSIDSLFQQRYFEVD